MKIGDRAKTTRTFNSSELKDYARLSGHVSPVEGVPEPLIGALFSFLLGMKLPGIGTMYLKQETRFLKIAAVGESLTASVEITNLRPEKQLADLSTICTRANGEIIACGRALVFVGEVNTQTDQPT